MFSKILVALDLEHPDANDELVQTAAKLANLYGADLSLLTVVEAAPVIVSQYLPDNYEHMAAADTEKRMAEGAAGLNIGSGKVTTEVRFGEVYKEILAQAEKTKTDLIILGSHIPNVADYLLGSNAARVVRHADCSVFVIR